MQLEVRRFDSPDETRTFEKGKLALGICSTSRRVTIAGSWVTSPTSLFTCWAPTTTLVDDGRRVRVHRQADTTARG